MKYTEVIERINNGTFDISTLKVKKYIGVLEKEALVDKICDYSINKVDNRIYFIPILKEIFTQVCLLLNYCDIEEEVETDYLEYVELLDLLNKYGIMEEIVEQIGIDYHRFMYILDRKINYIKEQHNTVESVLANSLKALLDKIPDEKKMAKIIKDIPKVLESLSEENKNIIKESVK